MTDNKRLKRFLLIFGAVALAIAAFALVHSLRGVASVYKRHPEKFQVAAEYFCAQTAERAPYVVFRPIPPGELPDEKDWPPEVAEAVRYLFHHSRCRYIFASRNSGVPYCEFNDRNSSYSRGDTGVFYTPRESGFEVLEDAVYPPLSRWAALSDHWFSFTLVSYNDYDSCG